LPSGLPEVISPNDNQNIVQPEDSMLIQIGFLYPMNYKFVSNNPMAAAQIFTYLPNALAYAGGFDISKIKMKKLVPYDTQSTLGYITTIAKLYYPRSMVETLRMDVRIPNSPLYNHPDQLVYNLTININPAIEIIPGAEDDGTSGGSGGSSSSGPQSPNSDILGDQPQDQQTPTQKATAAGIAVGAFTVAAAYGAAMFVVARRYKRKKQAHQRSSSVSQPSSNMRYTGSGSPALMGGALLSRDFSTYGGVAAGGVAGGRDSHGSGRSGMNNSGRTAYISAPMAAENSLGWN
jgi:hypothetical protein